MIHAVGPIWNGQPICRTKLYDAYKNSLLRASEHNLKSIAFPSISTGIFRFPIDLAAPIAIEAIKDFIDKTPNSSLKTIAFALWPNFYNQYRDALLQRVSQA